MYRQYGNTVYYFSSLCSRGVRLCVRERSSLKDNFLILCEFSSRFVEEIEFLFLLLNLMTLKVKLFLVSFAQNRCVCVCVDSHPILLSHSPSMICLLFPLDPTVIFIMAKTVYFILLHTFPGGGIFVPQVIPSGSSQFVLRFSCTFMQEVSKREMAYQHKRTHTHVHGRTSGGRVEIGFP